mgnify:CR=1 FL=1
MSVIVWSGTKKCSYKINVRQTEVYRTADGLRVNIKDLCPLVILQDTQVQWPTLQTLAYKVHFTSENRCLKLSWSTRTRRVSKILLNPQVRKLLVKIQRQIIQPFLISSFLTSVFCLVTKLSFGFANVKIDLLTIASVPKNKIRFWMIQSWIFCV